jgi:hypothetical protein
MVAGRARRRCTAPATSFGGGELAMLDGSGALRTTVTALLNGAARNAITTDLSDAKV